LTDSIKNFKPRLDIEQKPILFLSNSYQTILKNFFNDSNQVLTKKEGFFTAMTRPWDWKWDRICSYPQIFWIYFNESISQARIDFRIGIQGGETRLKKENGEWKIVSSRLTWIE